MIRSFASYTHDAVRCARRLMFVAALLIPANSSAQEIVVRGRVLGPDDRPLAQQSVVLHRVDAVTGTTIAEDTSDAAGLFVLRAAAVADTAAVYFVASRYQGELYIGAPFRPEADNESEQVIQVGVAESSASALVGGAAGSPVSGGRPVTSRNWLLLLIPLVGVAAVAAAALVPRTHIAPERALLIRIAEIDERMSSATALQQESLRAERIRLLTQLRAS